jgi:hypothetical protein
LASCWHPNPVSGQLMVSGRSIHRHPFIGTIGQMMVPPVTNQSSPRQKSPSHVISKDAARADHPALQTHSSTPTHNGTLVVTLVATRPSVVNQSYRYILINKYLYDWCPGPDSNRVR